jgi:hypothetical protein
MGASFWFPVVELGYVSLPPPPDDRTDAGNGDASRACARLGWNLATEQRSPAPVGILQPTTDRKVRSYPAARERRIPTFTLLIMGIVVMATVLFGFGDETLNPVVASSAISPVKAQEIAAWFHPD